MDLGKLTNDKSGFRDWKISMEDALASMYRGREFLKTLEWIETPSTKLTGKEEMEGVMQQTEDKAGVPQHKETYKKIGQAMVSLLLDLSENKSESFLMCKRASSGWTAWSRVN